MFPEGAIRVLFGLSIGLLALALFLHFPNSEQPEGLDMRAGWKYLSSAEATQMDADLMGPEFGFSVDQLMELAGLAVATAVQRQYPRVPASVLICCGPGNNGGDGLVAARHLHHFGYTTSVLYPKHKDVDIYNRLVRQLSHLPVSFVDQYESGKFDIVVDSIFGYSFSGSSIREPFASIIAQMAAEKKSKILSVDVPSGWHVEQGDVLKTNLQPDALVSLTAPKQCAQHFKGSHFLGGRFVPDKMAKQYGLDTLPAYEESNQIVKLH